MLPHSPFIPGRSFSAFSSLPSKGGRRRKDSAGDNRVRGQENPHTTRARSTPLIVVDMLIYFPLSSSHARSFFLLLILPCFVHASSKNSFSPSICLPVFKINSHGFLLLPLHYQSLLLSPPLSLRPRPLLHLFDCGLPR